MRYSEFFHNTTRFRQHPYDKPRLNLFHLTKQKKTYLHTTFTQLAYSHHSVAITRLSSHPIVPDSIIKNK